MKNSQVTTGGIVGPKRTRINRNRSGAAPGCSLAAQGTSLFFPAGGRGEGPWRTAVGAIQGVLRRGSRGFSGDLGRESVTHTLPGGLCSVQADPPALFPDRALARERGFRR